MIRTLTKQNEDFHYLSRIYTHGILEDEAGYDLIACDDTLLNRINSFNESDEKSLVRFEKFLINNKEKQVVLYIWKGKETNETMGLVVNCSDTESVQYATEKMKVRVDCI